MPRDAPSDPVLRPEAPGDAAAFEALFDSAFGPGRLAKTAERVRERTAAAPELSVGLWEGERLVGAARQHRLRVGDSEGAFLGPFAVADDRRGLGYGPRLIEAACDRARQDGLHFVLLVGPQAYFAPLRFTPAPANTISLGGPIDPARLLVRQLTDGPSPAGALA